jgi:YD repeat-containing protein
VRKLLTATLVLSVTVLLVLFAGPLTSGALLMVLPSLLLPGDALAAEHGLAESYEPLHQGHAALVNGSYSRQNEDLVVHGTPAIILRRAYDSRDKVSRHFGIGAWHNGEIFLSGDGKTFQWAKLILADGIHIPFERTSAGSSVFNAMFQNRTTAGEWTGARLGWTGINWALRKRDGTLMIFRGCGPGSVCSIVQWRDVDGHVVNYSRDRRGQLRRIESSADRWIAFEYDGSNRVIRAHASNGREVRYDYDREGRLSQALSRDGGTYR